MNTEIKLIVDPTISQEQAGTAFYELEWEMVDIFPPSPTSPYRVVYRPWGSPHVVSYVRDAQLAVSYLVIEAAATSALTALRAKLPTLDANAVLGSLRSATSVDDARLALRYAAIVAPPTFDEEWFAAIRPWFADPHRGVRLTAVFVTAYLGWPEFEPILAEIIRDDTDEDVREDARVILDGMKRGLGRNTIS
jgi:hypothetical protein